MTKVTYLEADGTSHVVDVAIGMSLMAGALRNGVSGIDGDCGGAAACATCRVYVDADWLASTGEAGADEREMLAAADDATPAARLSCQIIATDDLDGLIVRLPCSQR